MKIIGITGGVGSGKSEVLSFMQAAFGAVVCQADHIAWKLQEPGEKCYNEIVTFFGKEILNQDKTINRKRLGEIVFADNSKLAKLNQIMHPAVKQFIFSLVSEEKCKGTLYFVLEAALLLEENYGQICDELWYVYCRDDVRRQRLKTSREYSDDKIDAIMRTQLSEVVFREQCQIVIDNSGKFEDTCYQIEKIMSRGEIG